jgi:hypothetical protein
MPTNYTGDPAGSNAPSPVPGPENFPIAAIPLASEGRTVSSIEQAYKTLADHIAWLKKPFANTTIGQKFLQRWRTAVGHTRFALDRNGLPAGTYMQWQEAWAFDAQVTTSGQNGSFLINGSQVTTLRWRAFTASGLIGSTHGIFVTPAKRDRDGAHGDIPRHGRLAINGADGLGNFVAVGSTPFCRLDATADVCLEWIGVSGSDLLISTVPEIQQGILEIFQDADYAEVDPRAARGLTFVREITNANWQAVARDGSGETKVDTGIPVTAGINNRFRIEFRGASVNDGGTAAAYFFFGQALVATITTNLPLTIPAIVYFGTKNTGGASITRSAGSVDMSVTPVNFACNMMPSVTT